MNFSGTRKRLWAVPLAFAAIALWLAAQGANSDAQTGAVVQVSQAIFQFGVGDSALSPDGTRLAYVGGAWDGEVLYLRNLGTGQTRVLAKGIPGWSDAQVDRPASSPDGTKLAFVAFAGETWHYPDQIFAINAEGSCVGSA